MACIFGALPSQSAPATPLSQSDDENEAEDSTASCPTIPCNSSPGFVTFKSEQNIQDYFARRMRELRDGKGIERIEEGDSGDEGVHHGTREDDVGNKKGNSDNCVERNSQKLKKQKKSRIEVKDDGGDTVNDEKIVSENFKKNICGNEDESNEKVDKKKSKKSKKSKRRKIDEIDGVEILENNIECVDDEVGQELCEDDVLSVGKGENIKTKKNKKKNKLKDMSVSKTIVNETNLCDEEAVPFEKEKIHRKKCKKRKTDELEMVANGTDQIEEDIGSFVKDKVKRKKKKKR